MLLFFVPFVDRVLGGGVLKPAVLELNIDTQPEAGSSEDLKFVRSFIHEKHEKIHSIDF